MKATRKLVINNLYIGILLGLMVDAVTLNLDLLGLKNLDLAYQYLYASNHWYPRLFALALGSVRNFKTFFIFLMNWINPFLSLIGLLSYLYFTTILKDKELLRMLNVLVISYLLITTTLVFGLLSQSINITISLMRFVTTVNLCVFVISVLNLVIKFVHNTCEFIEVKKRFNYNGLERGAHDVRNDE